MIADEPEKPTAARAKFRAFAADRTGCFLGGAGIWLSRCGVWSTICVVDPRTRPRPTHSGRGRFFCRLCVDVIVRDRP